jgi:hypothetical protein
MNSGLKGLDLKGLDLKGLDLKGSDLKGLDLKGLDLKGLNLKGLNLKGLDWGKTFANGLPPGSSQVCTRTPPTYRDCRHLRGLRPAGALTALLEGRNRVAGGGSVRRLSRIPISQESLTTAIEIYPHSYPHHLRSQVNAASTTTGRHQPIGGKRLAALTVTVRRCDADQGRREAPQCVNRTGAAPPCGVGKPISHVISARFADSQSQGVSAIAVRVVANVGSTKR